VTLSLSRPKLVPHTTSSCGHIEYLPELDVGNPLGARTSMILVSLSPTIRIRRTKHTKIYLPAVSNPNNWRTRYGHFVCHDANKGPDGPFRRTVGAHHRATLWLPGLRLRWSSRVARWCRVLAVPARCPGGKVCRQPGLGPGRPQHGGRSRAEPVPGALPLCGVRHLHACVWFAGGGDGDLG
jgi:hypothetical protein